MHVCSRLIGLYSQPDLPQLSALEEQSELADGFVGPTAWGLHSQHCHGVDEYLRVFCHVGFFVTVGGQRAISFSESAATFFVRTFGFLA